VSARPTASISIDLDNLWSYLRTHGDPAWEARPSFIGPATGRLLDLLDRHGLTATVFVVGADAEREDGAKAVAEIVAAGHEVANHSYLHQPWLHRLSPAQLDDELGRTEEALVAAGAPKPVGFRGPGFSLTREMLALLDRRGYRYDATTLPTWIGPLARAYHDRSATAARDGAGRPGEAEPGDLFGPVTDVLAPVHPYRWQGAGGLVELPVTTMPLLRVPIHGSYLLQLHQVSPKAARAYFATALRLCRLRGVQPSLLLHPTDVLDLAEAPGMEFFPGMGVPGAQKVALMDWALGALTRRFDVVGTGVHAERVAAAVTRTRAVSRLKR
jgi:polysaccharide deacetylase